MKSKKMSIISVIVMIILIASIGCVNAANHTFTFTVSSEELTAKLGDTITIDLGIADIDQATDGINAIQGKVTYDEELFESVDIVSGGSNWSVSFNQEEGNDLKGTFVISNMNSVKNASVVAKLKAKIKSNTTVETGKIYLNDVFSSYGIEETEKVNKTVTVDVLKQNVNPPTDDNEIPTPNTPSGNTQTPPISNIQKPSNSAQKPTASLPKAGLSSWITIAIVVSIIGAIVGYVKYKKAY